MAEISLILLKVFLFAWVFTRFKPLQWLLELLPDRLVLNLIKLLLSCMTCISLWFGLVYTQDIWLSAGASFIGFWYDKLIGWRENVVRLK